MDHSVARMIAGQQADAIIVKLGINIHNFGSLSLRTFRQSALGFLRTLRDGHPAVPILIISPIWGSWRETNSASVTNPAVPYDKKDPFMPTLQDMRSELETAVDILVQRGDKSLYYVSGLRLFSSADAAAGLMPDGLHPNAVGYELLGRRIAQFAFGPDGILLPGRVPFDGNALLSAGVAKASL